MNSCPSSAIRLPCQGVPPRRVVRGAGIEPARGCPHRILSPGRLPVPPPSPASTPSGHEANEGISHVTLNSTSHTPLALNQPAAEAIGQTLFRTQQRLGMISEFSHLPPLLRSQPAAGGKRSDFILRPIIVGHNSQRFAPWVQRHAGNLSGFDEKSTAVPAGLESSC